MSKLIPFYCQILGRQHKAFVDLKEYQKGSHQKAAPLQIFLNSMPVGTEPVVSGSDIAPAIKVEAAPVVAKEAAIEKEDTQNDQSKGKKGKKK